MIFSKQKEEEVIIRKVQGTKEELVRRRKKEPPKPWGKKERFLVLFILLFTILTSIILALSAREWKLPGLPRIKFPAISIFQQETIVLENDKKNGSKEIAERSQKIVTEFKNTTNDLSGVYGLFVIDLKSGYSFGISEDESFTAASLIKLPVMAAAYLESEKGSLNLETIYTLKDSDKIGGSGSLYYKPAGTKLSYKDLLMLMGKQSDNTAFGIMKKIIGDTKINEVIKTIGMSSTSLTDNSTSLYDIGIFFKKLWEGKITSKDSADEILGNLTDTTYENWIAAGIPADIRVAHKYGREVHVVNDAGIVYADNPFVLVILTKGVIESEADSIFPSLAGIVYDGLEE
ncbi:MAG TPA: serine hydrolase [Patescibacteria group bacterium]|nr:serine hydrolase [Patescibacteria group bacterium]